MSSDKSPNPASDTKSKAVFRDRRHMDNSLPDGITACRRGKRTAQFGVNTDWYLATSIEVSEIDDNASLADFFEQPNR